MATLSTMRSRINADLGDLGSAYAGSIDDAIRSALRFHAAKPFWFLREEGTLTLSAGSSSVALPADFSAVADPRGLRILIGSTRQRLTYYPDYDGQLKDMRAMLVAGIPSACAILGSALYVNCTANAEYEITLPYWRKDATEPTADADTSLWFTDGYDLIRATALALLKSESLEYDATDPDWARVMRYESALVAQNNRRFAGAC